MVPYRNNHSSKRKEKMNVGFYYHITIVVKPDGIFVPGSLGLFVDELATNFDTLYYFAHRATENEEADADYKLTQQNIALVDLGVKTPAWHREIMHERILKKPLSKIKDCDVMIVRSPTPLSIYISRYLKNAVIWYMLVGDYLEAIDHYKTQGVRGYFIYYYLHIHDFFFQRKLKGERLIVNSPKLYDKYKLSHKHIYQIKTTTLSKRDFYFRVDTCQKEEIQLLYTGAYNPSKGIFELIAATRSILDRNYKVHLHIVGWENDKDSPVEKQMHQMISSLCMNTNVTIHGKKQVGEELNAMYRSGDVYILPTYHEGFPRTIWEAMANGIPVVTTRVGGIPGFINDRRQAILIEPKDVELLTEAIVEVISNSNLRRSLIKEAYELVSTNTLDIQTKRLAHIITTYG